MKDSKSLIDKLVEIGLPLLVTGGLLGGINFFLFERPAMENKLVQDQALELTNTAISDKDKVIALLSVADNNWLLADRRKTDGLIETSSIQLAQTLNSGQLSSDFISKFMGEYLTGSSAITSEKGTIAGYTFADKTYQDFQQDVINFEDSGTTLLNTLEADILKWNSLSPDDKTQRLVDLQHANDATVQFSNTMSTRLPQLLQTFNVQFTEFNSRSQERFQTSNELTIKSILYAILIEFCVVCLGLLARPYLRSFLKRGTSTP